jgi:hypothetical protein
MPLPQRPRSAQDNLRPLEDNPTIAAHRAASRGFNLRILASILAIAPERQSPGPSWRSIVATNPRIVADNPRSLSENPRSLRYGLRLMAEGPPFREEPPHLHRFLAPDERRVAGYLVPDGLTQVTRDHAEAHHVEVAP